VAIANVFTTRCRFGAARNTPPFGSPRRVTLKLILSVLTCHQHAILIESLSVRG
jgi:hypothetical protein